jgi:uncharacterized protein (DUF1697 family)
MTIFVALFRAVNVGGTGKLPMQELQRAAKEAGLQRVSTYLASGNLLFESELPVAQLRDLLVRLIADRFGLTRHGPILRSVAVLRSVLAANPFPDAAALRPKQLLVACLEHAPALEAPANLARLARGERFQLEGDHLYIDFVDGIPDSKIAGATLDRALKVASTARNWNTLSALIDLAGPLQ